MLCYLRMKTIAFNVQLVKEMLARVVQSTTNQHNSATVAISGKSDVDTILQMHHKKTYSCSFSSYSLCNKNYEEVGAISNDVDYEN